MIRNCSSQAFEQSGLIDFVEGVGEDDFYGYFFKQFIEHLAVENLTAEAFFKLQFGVEAGPFFRLLGHVGDGGAD